MGAGSDFSGLAISVWAFASAPAIAPIDSLERCMAALHLKKVETDSTRFRTFGTHAMPDSFFGVLRHERFQLGLGLLMFKEGRSAAAKTAGKFRPRIGCTHVDDAYRFDPWPRWLDPKQ